MTRVGTWTAIRRGPVVQTGDAVGFVPIFTVAYYSYFVLLFLFSIITIRDRRLMYEGVVGYFGCAVVGFAFFWLVPSRMIQPDISWCTSRAFGPRLADVAAAAYRRSPTR